MKTMADLTSYTELSSLLANIATFLGIPIGVYVLWRDRTRERAQRELTTFSQLSLAYGEHLKLCLDRPELETVEHPPALDSTPGDRAQHLFLCLVTNMLEAAYFLYRDADSEFRRNQWTGWNDYMKTWVTHPRLLDNWNDIVAGYDSAFVDHMRQLRDEVNHLGTQQRV